jgi:alpha-glucosidase
MAMTWWQHGVVYQIYPRSFQDNPEHPDGVGDLRGLIQRLDYLNDGSEQSLGVDAIWLSPFYPSPMADFGYDISDYCAIDPLFGSMADFDELLAAAHKRGIRIILDLVVNHSSDQHPWFIESCDPHSDKADWYIWQSGSADRPPNNWLACFGGRGWSWHPKRQAWYFHSFLPQQPDLNWRNPQVQHAIRRVMEFWLDKGVDGFRLDVVNLYFKDQQLNDNPTHTFKIARPYDRQHHVFDRDQPEMHPLLRQMRQWLDAYPDRMIVGEVMLADDATCELPVRYYGNNDELHQAFNFEFLRCPFKATAFRDVIANWNRLLGDQNWPNYTLSNHDFVRHASRYTGVGKRFRSRAGKADDQLRLKLLATMLLTLRGTPYLYYGEEIAMPEQPVGRAHLRDPVGIRYWPLHSGRDGCRKPMMWDHSGQAFSQAQHWLPHQPLAGINVEHQQLPHQHTHQHQHQQKRKQDQEPLHSGSLLNWYKTLIWLRKKTPALHKGSLTLLDSHSDVLAYQRETEHQCVIVLLNFSGNTVALKTTLTSELLTETQLSRTPLANNYPSFRPDYLLPYQAVILTQD